MKNIDNDLIELYNQNMNCEASNVLYDYLQGNVVHLQEDIVRFAKRKGGSSFEAKRFSDLLEKCVAIQDKITYHLPLDERDIVHFGMINKYNSAKNLEFKRLALFTIAFAIFGLIVSIFFK